MHEPAEKENPYAAPQTSESTEQKLETESDLNKARFALRAATYSVYVAFTQLLIGLLLVLIAGLLGRLPNSVTSFLSLETALALGWFFLLATLAGMILGSIALVDGIRQPGIIVRAVIGILFNLVIFCVIGAILNRVSQAIN